MPCRVCPGLDSDTPGHGFPPRILSALIPFGLHADDAAAHRYRILFKNLHPTMWARDAYAVDYRSLYEQGFRGIIFDIDNTLVTPNAPSDERARQLFCDLREMGFAAVILSNNTGRRARIFAAEVGADVVPGAHKPFPGKYREAMRIMGTDEGTTVCIGDQIFTDIFGAGNAHISSVLTDPLTSRELFLVQWRRPFEKKIRTKARMRAEQEKL